MGETKKSRVTHTMTISYDVPRENTLTYVEEDVRRNFEKHVHSALQREWGSPLNFKATSHQVIWKKVKNNG